MIGNSFSLNAQPVELRQAGPLRQRRVVHFSVNVVEPIEFKGAQVEGQISKVKSGGRAGKDSEIALKFRSIRMTDGRVGRFEAQIKNIYEVVGAKNEGQADDDEHHGDAEQDVVARHRRVEAAQPPAESVGVLAARRLPIWVRYVLVPGLTDDPDDIAKTAAFAGELGNVERVDVLPFHQMGKYKWERLGLEYKLANTSPPTNELVEQTCALFRSSGLKAH